MEDEFAVRKLMDCIATVYWNHIGEPLAPVKYIPAILLTKDFIRDFCEILRIKRKVISERWKSFFDTCYKKMLSSHEEYLTFVMFACIREHEFHINIFESFIDVCTLLLYLIIDTVAKTEMNFFPWVADIFVVFYKNELEVRFGKCGGIPRLVEYTRSHRLLEKKRRKNPLVTDNPSIFYDSVDVELAQEEIKRDQVVEILVNPDEVANDKRGICLAKLLLSLPYIKLSAFPSYNELIMKIVAYRKIFQPKKPRKSIASAKLGDSNIRAALNGCSGTISNSKTNSDTKQVENIKSYEDIIQSVIRHNHSKISTNKNITNRIQEDADGVLEHLKDAINSLIAALDKSANE